MGPSPGPSHTAPATSQGPVTRTRTSTEKDHHPSKEELVKRSGIASQKHASELLKKSGYIPRDEPTTIACLSHALLLLAANAPNKTLIEGVRAVAILLENADISSVGERIASCVADKISHLITCSEKASASISEVHETVRVAADRLSRTGEQACDDIQKSTELIKTTLEAFEPGPDASPTPTTAPRTGLSYAAAVSNNLPAAHPHTLARARTRERQILIDKDPLTEANSLADLSEEELVAKANVAIEGMDEGGQDDIHGAKAVGARKLSNGGVLLEMNSGSAAAWIRREHEEFLKLFGASSVIKNRALTIIIENVPIGFNPEDLAEHTKVENASSLRPGSITAMRWIKPIHRRSANQRTAHVIARFCSPAAANIAIRDGLITAGKRSWARRMKKEPRRCLNCHEFTHTHLAATCDKQTTCGTCGEGHRTATCEVTDQPKFWCSNCQTSGHASWDRSCPKFVEACKGIEAHDPEATYKYFPCEDEWTWEQRWPKNQEPEQRGQPSNEQELRRAAGNGQLRPAPADWLEDDLGDGADGTSAPNPSSGARRTRQTNLNDAFRVQPSPSSGPNSSPHT